MPGRKYHLPDNFEVSERMRELAAEKGWPNPDDEIEAFRDYHLARGSTFVDWEAAFRTWLRNAEKFGDHGKSNSEPRGMAGLREWHRIKNRQR